MTSLNVTLNNLIQEVNDIASAHLMLNDFRYGSFLEIYQRGGMQYFTLLMNTSNGNIDEHYVTLKLELMVLDKVFDDNTNLNDVESETLQILQDVYSVITYSDRWQKFSKLQTKSVPTRKFLEKSKDKASGWSMELSLKLKRQNGICDLPMQGYDFEGVYTPSCAGVRIIEDGLFKELIASGGEFSYVTGGGDPVDTDVNGVPTTVDTPAGDSLAINVEYANSTPVGTLVTNTANEKKIEIPNPVVALNTANIFKTGAVTSFQSQDDGDKEFGRGVNFTTLDFNNGFGNTNRFTDDLGTQIYASLVIVDWSTWDNVNDTVLAYYKTPEASATLTNQLNGQPYTKNALSDWWVCNIKELMNVNNYEITRDYLNYAPFNFAYLATTDRLWVSTRDSAGVGIFSGNTSISVGGQSGVYKALLCRTYTMAELSL